MTSAFDLLPADAQDDLIRFLAPAALALCFVATALWRRRVMWVLAAVGALAACVVFAWGRLSALGIRPDMIGKPARPASAMDGSFSVQLPPWWHELAPAEEAVRRPALSAGNAVRGEFLTITREEKALLGGLNLKDYAEKTLAAALRRVPGAQAGPQTPVKVQGATALACQVDGAANGRAVTWRRVCVETPTHFHQVCGWASRDTSEELVAVVDRVARSLKETPAAAP